MPLTPDPEPVKIPKGKLYMLQTRTGKRTAHAALQIAVDMANEGLISKSQAPSGA